MIDEATPAMVYQAVCYCSQGHDHRPLDRDIIKNTTSRDAKIVYYMSMEFLTGRFLGNNIITGAVSRRRSRRHSMNWDLT